MIWTLAALAIMWAFMAARPDHPMAPSVGEASAVTLIVSALVIMRYLVQP